MSLIIAIVLLALAAFPRFYHSKLSSKSSIGSIGMSFSFTPFVQVGAVVVAEYLLFSYSAPLVAILNGVALAIASLGQTANK